MRTLYIASLLAWLACGARADTVEMKPTRDGAKPGDDGLKLEGKVHRDEEDYIILLMGSEEEAQVRIPKSRIKNIEYDIETRRAKLQDDDFAGHYEVALWAMEKGKYPDAIPIFETLKEVWNEGMPPELHKHLGRAFEQRQQLDKALDSYALFLLSKPKDAEIEAKVADLTRTVKPEEPKVAKAGEDKPKPKITDGLEADGQWVVEGWGNPGRAQFYTQAPSGDKMVLVQASGGNKDKTAILRICNPLLDLSTSKEMIFRIYHTSPTALPFAIAYINSTGEWHETQQFRVPPTTWQNKTVKIDGKPFKATRNEFRSYELELKDAKEIKQIAFLVYGQREFTCYIDFLFFK